jgi:hypothetical protein
MFIKRAFGNDIGKMLESHPKKVLKQFRQSFFSNAKSSRKASLKDIKNSLYLNANKSDLIILLLENILNNKILCVAKIIFSN